MDEELRKVATWFKSSKLSLNISKAKYPLFHCTRKRKYMPNILLPLHIDNVPIKREFVTNLAWGPVQTKVNYKLSIAIRNMQQGS